MVKARSPNYPGVSLREAVKLAKMLHDAEKGQHLIPKKAIFEHWGYSAKSSSALVALGALGKFGLLKYEGQGDARKGKLTGRALAILLPDSPHRDEALREAALAPSIHKEIWEHYGGKLPSDSSLSYDLITERKFTQSGAAGFIRQFHSTVEFANLQESPAGSGNTATENGDGFSIGDYVQWESQGVLRLPEARQIVGFYDPEHAVLDGSSTGVPVEELIAADPPPGVSPPAIPPLSPTGPPGSSKVKQATLPLDEGVMTFQWSSPLSTDSRKLAVSWIDNIVKKLISRESAPEVLDKEEGGSDELDGSS